jgi:hypothetical protein
MDATILATMFLVGSIALVAWGIYLMIQTNQEGWGAIVTTGGLVILTWWFPQSVESIREVGDYATCLAAVASYVYYLGWMLFLVFSCILPFVVWAAAGNTRTVNLIHWAAPAPTTTPPGGTPTPAVPRAQWFETTVLSVLSVVMFIYTYSLYQSRPDGSFEELTKIAEEHDALFHDPIRLQPFYQPYGRLRAAITLKKDLLSPESLKALVESVEQIAKDSDEDDWKGLTVKEVTSATLYSFDGRHWGQIEVTFDGTLPAAPPKRTEAEEVKGVEITIDNESDDAFAENTFLIDKLSTEILQKAGPAGLSKVISGQKATKKSAGGKNLFSTRRGSTFRRTK